MAGVEEEGKGTRFVPGPCMINDGARIMPLSALKRWKRQVFGSTRLLQPLSVSTGLEGKSEYCPDIPGNESIALRR